MQLVANVLEPAHHALDHLPVRLQLLGLRLSQLHADYQLLEDVVVVVVLAGQPLPLLELLLELEVEAEGLGVDLVEVGQEVAAEVLVVLVQRLEGEDAGDDQEDVRVAALDHVPELLVLLGDALDGAREVQQVALLLAVAEVVAALLPAALVLHQQLHQVRVVLELRVHHLDVLVVLAQQRAQAGEGAPDLLAEDADGLGLVARDPAQDALGLEQDGVVEVVAALPAVVGDLVDLADDLAQLGPRAQVVLAVYQDLPLHLLPDLHRGQALLGLDGLRDQAPRLHLDAHQLQHVQPLEGAPARVELQQVLADFRQPGLQTRAGSLLRDLAVEIPEAVLELEELDHESAAVVEDVLREGVLLAVDPQVREPCISPLLPSWALSRISVR